MNKKTQVKQILEGLQGVGTKPPLTKDGGIDVNRIDEVPEFARAIQRLKALEVTGKYLFKNGFIPAGMILGKKL